MEDLFASTDIRYRGCKGGLTYSDGVQSVLSNKRKANTGANMEVEADVQHVINTDPNGVSDVLSGGVPSQCNSATNVEIGVSPVLSGGVAGGYGGARVIESGGVAGGNGGARVIESEKEKGGASFNEVETGDGAGAIGGGIGAGVEGGAGVGGGGAANNVGFSGVRQMSREKLKKLIQHINGGRGEC